jgi:hypothetical protein
MNPTYYEFRTFKYEVNLLFVVGELEKARIDFQTTTESPFKLYISQRQLEQATELINSLELDDEPVNEESDGYLRGYAEWINNQYVTGYFTGGSIPLWMHGKKYSKYFGPIFFALGALMFISMIVFAVDSWENFLSPASALSLILLSAYIVCGIYMIKRGYSRS